MHIWSEFEKELLKAQKINLLGPMPSSCSKLINQEIPSLFVDGGLDNFPPQNFPLKSSIGDGDSIQDNSLIKKFPKRKDYSDFLGALRTIPPNIKEISCYGFLGGDRAYEHANIFDALSLVKKQPCLVTFDRQVALLPSGSWELHYSGKFSLFNLNKFNLNTSILGADYELKDEKLEYFSSHGLGNNSNKKTLFKIQKNDVLLLMTSQDFEKLKKGESHEQESYF